MVRSHRVVFGSLTIGTIFLLFWTQISYKHPTSNFVYIWKAVSTEKLHNIFHSSLKSEKQEHFLKDGVHFRLIPDVSSLHTRFTHLTNESCNNTCDLHDKVCNATTRDDWIKVFRLKVLKGVPLFSDHEYFFPWEFDYLRNPPLNDVKTLPSLQLSKVYFHPENKIQPTDKLSSYSLNAVVLRKSVPATFRVNLFDGYGSRRRSGGDELRAWLKGTRDRPSGQEVWATARVNDLGNGSYDVIVTPTWTGNAELNIAVSYPREYIRTATHHFRIGSHRFIFGLFKRENIQEVTLCHSNPNVPGRPCVCNVTHFNGLPYYCGKPLDNRLSCNDWSLFNTVPAPGFSEMTQAEKDMDKNISRPPSASRIHHNLTIHVFGNDIDPDLPTCRHANRSRSWTMTSPRGVWSQNKTIWNSLVCREPVMTSNRIHKCLKSTTVWMLGDSNVRQMAIHISRLLGCKGPGMNQWPAISVCRNKIYNITIRFRPHEHPLYVANRWLKLLDNGAVTETLSSIPSTGDHFVILHYYLHFSSSHLNVLQQRLQILKTAISNLLSRNPKVLVAVRGPHTSAVEWKRNHNFAGDVLGPFIRQIYVDTFRDLQERVVFLDGWDMSISFENELFHPPLPFISSMWRTLLAYKCH